MLSLRATLLLWACATAAAANPALDAGRQLFTGATPLQARMAGHAQPLPAPASRCINCHATGSLQVGGGTAFGPRLDAASLMQPQARRGGPPSRYDAALLCRALRAGVDPAQVLLATSMPRYAIDDTACRQLWVFLTATPL